MSWPVQRSQSCVAVSSAVAGGAPALPRLALCTLPAGGEDAWLRLALTAAPAPRSLLLAPAD
eukprot:11929318-Alexandrium_andersonii.AAC.1